MFAWRPGTSSWYFAGSAAPLLVEEDAPVHLGDREERLRLHIEVDVLAVSSHRSDLPSAGERPCGLLLGRLEEGELVGAVAAAGGQLSSSSSRLARGRRRRTGGSASSSGRPLSNTWRKTSRSRPEMRATDSKVRCRPHSRRCQSRQRFRATAYSQVENRAGPPGSKRRSRRNPSRARPSQTKRPSRAARFGGCSR